MDKRMDRIDRYYVSYGTRKEEYDGSNNYAIRDRVIVDAQWGFASLVSTHKDREEARRLCELANSAWRDGHELDKP